MVRMRIEDESQIEHGTRFTDEFTSRISLIDKPNGAFEDDKGHQQFTIKVNQGSH